MGKWKQMKMNQCRNIYFYILILFYLSRQWGENHTRATEILQVQTLLVQTLAANIQECDKKYKKATRSFNLLVYGWDALLIVYLSERRKKKTKYSHSVIQSGHPITSLFHPQINVCVCVCVCIPPRPLTSFLLAPCGVSLSGEGASRPFEVSLQLRGLTPQVSPWLFTQSGCNSAGKPRLCHEYKARLHANGVSCTSALKLFWPASDRVTSSSGSCSFTLLSLISAWI